MPIFKAKRYYENEYTREWVARNEMLINFKQVVHVEKYEFCSDYKNPPKETLYLVTTSIDSSKSSFLVTSAWLDSQFEHTR